MISYRTAEVSALGQRKLVGLLRWVGFFLGGRNVEPYDGRLATKTRTFSDGDAKRAAAFQAPFPAFC